MVTEQGGRITLTFSVLYPSKEARDATIASRMEQGVAASYDRLGELLAAAPAGGVHYREPEHLPVSEYNGCVVLVRRNLMNRIVVERRVSDDGLLQLTMPLGADQAGRAVRVTVEPVRPKKEMTAEEWRGGIVATAGGWQGEFERPPQGELEEREPLS